MLSNFDGYENREETIEAEDSEPIALDEEDKFSRNSGDLG